MGLINNLGTAIFGTTNERTLKKYAPLVNAINQLESEVEALSDNDLKARTDHFRQQFKDGTSLKDLLVPAFATVREAAKRTLGQRHYDVQLIGGMVLHDGNIAEMKTGEGKTLVSTLAAYLNALSGKPVHVVTVNDYLASRDSEWMGRVFAALGLTTGCITHDMPDEERKTIYARDITYGTNNEFGFDYLRDNMKYDMEDMVQRGHGFAIIDEVDSILIDEARTPLIISGPLEDKTDLYVAVDKLIPSINEKDYELDEKQRTVTFTEEGTEHAEQLLKDADLLEGDGLYDSANVTIVHHINQALKAHVLFTRDKDYIVKNNEVVIIDEFTGRMMEGRRYSEGLHQALEAKEGADIQPENQTLASITFQNYFRLYSTLSGMTGTAVTEREEFLNIYGLDVVEIPTNLPIARVDENDEIYRSVDEKFDAIITQIEDCANRKQPILVGTTSIEKSETLSELLKGKKVAHKVLNARHHEQEAQIVADAGVPGAVTIATNMAGRGTDIQLGGNFEMRVEQEVGDMPEGTKRDAAVAKIKDDIETKKAQALEAGGLYVIGTERHESRRIDNQLRGRSGRQGDPGHSKFYLSLQDDLLRIFGSDRMESMLEKLGLEQGEAIAHKWINKALERAQKKVEAHNYDIRKNVLKYDDVMNGQRKLIFEQRIEFMSADDVSETIKDMRHQLVDDLVTKYIPANSYADQWQSETLQEEIARIFAQNPPITEWAAEEGVADNEIYDRIIEVVDQVAAKKATDFTAPVMREIEKSILLQTLDHLWREHLVTLEHLRQVIHLRGIAQRDPLNEFQTESFSLFEQMLDEMREQVTGTLSHVEPRGEEDLPSLDDMAMPEMELNMDQLAEDDEYGVAYEAQTIRNRAGSEEIDPSNPDTWGKVSRNSPCPCQSGKKYKHCHGAIV